MNSKGMEFNMSKVTEKSNLMDEIKDDNVSDKKSKVNKKTSNNSKNSSKTNKDENNQNKETESKKSGTKKQEKKETESKKNGTKKQENNEPESKKNGTKKTENKKTETNKTENVDNELKETKDTNSNNSPKRTANTKKPKTTSKKQNGNQIEEEEIKVNKEKESKEKNVVNLSKTSEKASTDTVDNKKNIIDEKANETEQIDNEEDNEESVSKGNSEEDESKYDTVSLKEIREAIENKVDKKQKKSVVKHVLSNIGIAAIMLVYLITIMLVKDKMNLESMEVCMKYITIGILAVGIAILEVSYKKDSSKIALNGIEVLTFGGTNLCLIYTAKLYFKSLDSIISYILIGIIGYYILKSIMLSVFIIKKYKKDNNDIKEIVKKKTVSQEEE